MLHHNTEIMIVTVKQMDNRMKPNLCAHRKHHDTPRAPPQAQAEAPPVPQPEHRRRYRCHYRCRSPRGNARPQRDTRNGARSNR